MLSHFMVLSSVVEMGNLLDQVLEGASPNISLIVYLDEKIQLISLAVSPTTRY